MRLKKVYNSIPTVVMYKNKKFARLLFYLKYHLQSIDITHTHPFQVHSVEHSQYY